MKNENNAENMSLSKQRKLERKKEIAKQKKQSVMNKLIWSIVAIVVVGLIVWACVSSAQKKANTISTTPNFSAELGDDGRIEKIKAADYITMPAYNGIDVAKADIEYSDESVDADIQAKLTEHKYVNDSAELVAADGDEVSIDYVGTVDGVEFDGGSAQDFALTLGSNSFIDDFEAQIVGHSVGETFIVDVTFPETYQNNPDLAGCDAQFTVTLKGIYTLPEFTDEFVAEYLSDYASTTDEYRTYLKDTKFESNLREYIQNYIVENTVVVDTPTKYMRALKNNYKANEYSSFQYTNSMFSSYYGYTVYASFEDYLSQTYSMTEAEYDASLEEKVQDNLKYSLFCQAVADAEGITATLDETKTYFMGQGGTEDDFTSEVGTYGAGYMVQSMLFEKVINMMCENANVQ